MIANLTIFKVPLEMNSTQLRKHCLMLASEMRSCLLWTRAMVTGLRKDITKSLYVALYLSYPLNNKMLKKIRGSWVNFYNL